MKKPPDILWLVIDCARYDHISSNGYPKKTTPNIDKLSKISTKYKSAFSTSGWTLPSVTSMFTGLFPHNHNTHNENTRYVLENPTLAQILQNNGYLENQTINDPHCLFKDLTSIEKGVTVFSGSLNGLIGNLFSKNLIPEIDEILKSLKDAFMDKFYIEIQRHNDVVFIIQIPRT